MIAEVLAIGSELVAGQLVNTNAAAVSEALLGIGIETVRHSAVGDDLERASDAIAEALRRVEVVVICGGLGPTHDDLTRDAVASATGRPLEVRPELVEGLERRWARMGRPMPEANRQQAMIPRGASHISNPAGTAPGIYLEQDGRFVFALPGVPAELAAMMESFVLPTLVTAGAGALQGAISTWWIRTAGIAESELAERLAGVISRCPSDPSGPRIAILASEGAVRVGVTARPSSRDAARKVESEISGLLADVAFGGADETLEGVVSARLRALGLRLAVAESLTGGMLASRIVSVPGASDIFLAGYVAYSAAAKERDLSVPASVISAFGLVSEETARAMASGARRCSGADLALSTTGEAGPLPAEAPVGTVCIGLAWEGGEAAWTVHMGGAREIIRRRTCTFALNYLRLHLLGRETVGERPLSGAES